MDNLTLHSEGRKEHIVQLEENLKKGIEIVLQNLYLSKEEKKNQIKLLKQKFENQKNDLPFNLY